MATARTRSALAMLLLTAFAARASADGVSKRPPVSTDEQAVAAIATFDEEFKAKGLKGEDRTSQRDFAMSKLVKVQHAKVVAALASVTRSNDATLRTLAVLYLGDQKALPGTAGKEAAAALERNKKDLVFVLSALDSFGNLRYVGATEAIRGLMQDINFTIKKAAIVASGRTRDVRLLPDLLKLLGIQTKADGSGDDKVVVEEGYSWDGASAAVDTGTPGPGDQQAAEAQATAQMAANQAAAAAAAGANGSGGEGGARPGGGGGGRSLSELAPHILKAVRFITGQSFKSGKQIVEWLSKNRAWLAAEHKAVADETKLQASEGKPN